MDALRNGLTVAAVVGCGLMAGIFFTFSTVVMPSLAQRTPAEGHATMQTMNVVIVNPLFLLVFLGTAAASLGLVVLGLASSDRASHLATIAAGSLYLVGSIVVTAAVNVPRNDALDAVDPSSAGAAEVWARYLSEWTAWNHVRTVSCVAALALFVIGLLSGAGAQ
jgi:uncharacterized membrane protein